MNRRQLILGAVVVALAITGAFAGATGPRKETRLKVRIENISSAEGQMASNGARWPFALSPGMWVVHGNDVTLFKEGKPAVNGLEAQAEDGNPEGLIKWLEGHHSSMHHGVFNVPVGMSKPGPIGPGAAYEFSIAATPGMKLSLALMFGQSNDFFYAPEASGIALFDRSGKPVNGDVTARLILWDAGTEVNQEPGIGSDQAPRQKAPNTGASENGVVRRAKDSAFYSRTAELFRVTITPEMTP